MAISAVMLLFLFLNTGAQATQTAAEGRVRILLREASEVPALDVGIYGNYLVDERLSFQRGSEMKLRALGNTIMVHYEGAVYRAQGEVRLIRHAVDESQENGLRLNGGLPLFGGNLYVRATDGLLESVIHLSMEEYLLGVVPHEMSDEFPLEALKAQAVAARTYSIISLDPSGRYDMQNTTNDQVYRGFLPENPNSDRAVKETAGLGLVYQGLPVQTFYTASNGGKIESSLNAWGREDIPYLQTKTDPYDIANPASEQRTADLPMDGAALHLQHPWLYEQLMLQAAPQAEALGYSPLAEHLSIAMLQSVQVQGTGQVSVRFTMTLYGRSTQVQDNEGEVALFGAPPTASPQPSVSGGAVVLGERKMLPHSVSVELPFFPEMEQRLNLSINARPNEVLTAEEVGQVIRLRSARYGHGVGMSQRGAQWMAANEGWTYEQILAFYYPGTTLVQISGVAGPLPSMDTQYLTTPGPRPTATPRPTSVPVSATAKPGEWYVVVTGIAANSSLNLRLAPDLNSQVLYQLLFGQKLLVHAALQGGWLEVSADGIKGYVMEQFVQKAP